MATIKNTKGQVVVVAQQLIAGTAKHLTSGTPVPLMGSSFTPAQITSELQSLVTLRADVDASKASTKAKIANEATQMPALRAFMSAFESFVKGAFGSSPDVLADFGITRKARVPLTLEAKTAAAAKRASTRAARHTMGSKQKLAVVGDVTGVVVTPVHAPAPIVPTPSSPTVPATSVAPTVVNSPTVPATSAVPTVVSNPTVPAASAAPTGAAAPHTA
jgi:hypothetical protein